MRKQCLFWIGLLFFFSACMPPEREQTANVRHNYIILLDLSDRLIKHPDQIERDKAVINSVYQLFENKIKKDLYIRSHDAIKIVLAPQADSPVKTLVAEDKLYINMEKVPMKDRKKQESQRKLAFFEALDDLYKHARFSSSTADYKGADIYKYFDEDIRRDLVGGENVINYVFVLTDGYMFVEGKQTGLSGWRTVQSAYDNLSVMLLETDPYSRDGEWDNMQRAWMNWFSRMGVRNVVIEKRTALAKVDELIHKFVDNGNEQMGYNLIDRELIGPQTGKVNFHPQESSASAEKKNVQQ